MARHLLTKTIISTILACTISTALGGTSKADAADTNDRETARLLVEQALVHEASGDLPARDNALNAALKFDRNCELAMWRSGFVLYGNKWTRFDEVLQTPDGQLRLVDYCKKREEHPDTVQGQLNLARWCLRNRLPDRARSHFTRVVDMNPEHAEARTKLGYLKVNGRWVLKEELQAAQELAQEHREAYRLWAPRIEEIVELLTSESPRRRRVGLKRLQAIQDPGAIASMEALLSDVSPDLALVTLETISKMPQQAATLSLARHALRAKWENVREVSVSLLKRRNEQEYVPALLSCMSTTVRSHTGLYYIPGGQLVYRHWLSQEAVGTQQLWVVDRQYHRIAMPAGDAVETAERAVANAEREAQLREQRIVEENERILQRNSRVAEVLAATTGQPFGPRPRLWWEWWNEHNGVYNGDKETISHYETETVLIADEGPSRRFRGGSESGGGGGGGGSDCLRAGTPIWTERGFVSIEKIQIGDRVLSQDPKSGELAYKPVLRTTVRPPDRLFRVVTDHATFEASPGHLFFVIGKGWIISRSLENGDRIHGLENTAAVVVAEEIGLVEETYNIVVADFHSYFVGKARVLSHDNTVREPSKSVIVGLELHPMENQHQ